MDNYEKIIRENLDRLYKNLPDDLDRLLPGQRQNDQFRFKAFGESCIIRPDGIIIADRAATGVSGILISLYALHANAQPCRSAIHGSGPSTQHNALADRILRQPWSRRQRSTSRRQARTAHGERLFMTRPFYMILASERLGLGRPASSGPEQGADEAPRDQQREAADAELEPTRPPHASSSRARGSTTA